MGRRGLTAEPSLLPPELHSPVRCDVCSRRVKWALELPSRMVCGGCVIRAVEQGADEAAALLCAAVVEGGG